MKRTTSGQQKEKKRNLAVQALFAALLLICGILGASVVSGMIERNRQTQEYRDQYTAYAEMLAQEKLRAENLEIRMESLTERLYANYDAILSRSGNEELQASWLKARILAGLTEVTGAGVQITLLDAKVITDSESATIIHDQDVLYVVDTLRTLGAYAISINGERIVSTSMIICNGPSIKINRKFCPIPIVITAVGDPETIANYLESDSYLLRRKADGIRVGVDRLDTAVVPAYRETQYIEQQISLLEVTR